MHHHPLNENMQVTAMENKLITQNNRLTSLEECCTVLATSSKNLETQLANMNGTIYMKRNEMTNAINNLHTSPNQHNNKLHKLAEDPAIDLNSS
jgi:hypothetical protein